MRDWWSKEAGWMNKHSCYIPEEFLGKVDPLPFIDLFGRAPIGRIVRYYHDNHYSNLDFRMDQWIASLLDRYQELLPYYERDEREGWARVLVHLVQIRWIDPFLWKAKRRLKIAAIISRRGLSQR